MAVSKHNTIVWDEIVNYVTNIASIDNNGKGNSIPNEWKANATYNTGTAKANNSTTRGWVVGSTSNYANNGQIDFTNIAKSYLNANGYNLKYHVASTQDLIKVQSMLIALIQANCNRFYVLGNPGGANMVYNRAIDTPKATGGVSEYTSPILYVSRNNNPGTNVPTYDPSNLGSRRYTTITPAILDEMKNNIQNYLNSVSTVTVSTSYCHTNCYCHSCCCSSTCGHGKWL